MFCCVLHYSAYETCREGALKQDDAARKQLAEAMESRRVELGITWRAVAEVGGTTVETLRTVRAGSNEPTPLTRRAIEKGLQWPKGRVAAFLAGSPPSEPEPAKPTLGDIRQMAESLQAQATELIARLDALDIGQQGETPQAQ